jgi:hypothetical protein
MNIEKILEQDPFSIKKNVKNKIILKYLKKLSIHHSKKSKHYKQIINSKKISLNMLKNLYDIPYLPATLFKKYLMKSISNKQIFKTLYSSGTTNQTPSKIILDKYTSSLQVKVLIKTVKSFLNIPRIPMLIIDNENSIKNRNDFTARGAGILGFSIFASERFFIFDKDMKLNLNELTKFINKNKNKKILIFGFTYIIWEFFYKEIIKSKKKINLSNSILIHGGGWKKLDNEKISNNEFKSFLSKGLKIKNVHNYYGMVEQTGSIYLECEKGFLHTSIFNDVIIRDQTTLKPLKICEKGLVNVISLIPHSYPGHSILTEDLGQIYGEDDCKCKRKGKYFKIFGRVKRAEVRGCSDTYE